MKLTELKILKEETVYKRVLDELKLKGLNKLYIKKVELIDYLDIVLAVINFLEENKKILKKVNYDQFENIFIIIIDEILEEINVNISEEQIEKILQLLKNSLLVKKVSKYLIDKLKTLYNNICCNTIKNINVKI